MNMFKSLLLAVMCGSVALVNAAQEPSVAPVADAPSKPAVTQDKVQAPKQQVADEKDLAQGDDTDFDEAALREWIESLTDEEKVQFEAAMNEEMASEVPAPTEVPSQEETTEAVEQKNVEPFSVENKVVAPETTQPSTELPQAAN